MGGGDGRWGKDLQFLEQSEQLKVLNRGAVMLNIDSACIFNDQD